ncbi:MAG: 2-C-methyl-D-erythritol 4-phosphate cytidylyltransferase [Propionibacteriaceae bacterium]|jgi:2-C-methyl-D-erythritol 4-phosphate cytidylyltransferase|nr:2-C-methyl-D-erythritol 4-phosphate cytidylyltransferase [Propionibacteriaceae bacterium]
MHCSRTVSAVLTCAGSGTRFGSNKLLVELAGTTVLERTVRALTGPPIDETIVVIDPRRHDEYAAVLEQAGLAATLVDGGPERYLSAQRGLAATTGDIVLVHDGVRPFVSPRLIARVLDAAYEHGAAMAGTPTVVQLKLVDDNSFVTGSLDRSHSWLGQTPQAFRRELLEQAYAQAAAQAYARVSDDADLVAEYTGTPVKIVLGDDWNIKITTPPDLLLAEQIVQRLEAGALIGASAA